MEMRLAGSGRLSCINLALQAEGTALPEIVPGMTVFRQAVGITYRQSRSTNKVGLRHSPPEVAKGRVIRWGSPFRPGQPANSPLRR